MTFVQGRRTGKTQMVTRMLEAKLIEAGYFTEEEIEQIHAEIEAERMAQAAETDVKP